MTSIPYPLILETERLLICSPEKSHAAGLRDAIAESLEELKAWMPWAQSIPTLPEATANCLRAKDAFRDGTDHRLHVFLREPHTFVGSSGLHDIHWSVPRVEIGYWVRTPFAGNGYITEAVSEITRYALEELGMNRVEIRMSARNSRSRAVAERVGFHLEGVHRSDARHVDGTLRDTCVFSMLRLE